MTAQHGDTAADRAQAIGGLLMLAAAVVAVAWANSPWAEIHAAFFGHPVTLGLGELALRKPVGIWINDGLMAVFFLLVGLEIKREMLGGELASRSRLVLPFAAALGGMIVPALLFATINRGDSAALDGWAVPCATDIAFSLAVLRLVASRVPPGLKVLLTAIAVLDDLGAIVVIAIFYTADLSPAMLVAACVPLAALVLLNRRGVRHVLPYVAAGFVLWLCVLKSGVHATLAGVITAMSIPAMASPAVAERRSSPLERAEHALQPWVTFAILPLFALANAGVSLAGATVGTLAAPVTLGVIVGLVAGKTVGVWAGCAIAVGIGSARLPESTQWRHVVGIAALCGIGFTMSLFIAALAFEASAPNLFAQAKLGVLAGSMIAAIVGLVVLRFAAVRPSGLRA